MGFGKILRYIMEKDHLTQREVALKSGTTEAAISKYIHGKREPHLSVAERILNALGYEFVVRKR